VQRTVSIAERYHLVDMAALAGDLNAESGAPEQRTDHVFAGAGLKSSDPATVGGLASDHLGIAVTLRSATVGRPQTASAS